MQFLSDLRAFNFVILTLYAANSVRWAFAGSWGDCLYWAAAFQITAAVTWGFNRA
jgi:hypothetical protein